MTIKVTIKRFPLKGNASEKIFEADPGSKIYDALYYAKRYLETSIDFGRVFHNARGVTIAQSKRLTLRDNDTITLIEDERSHGVQNAVFL